MSIISRLSGRSGRRYDGAVVRAELPRHAGSYGYFATKSDGSPNRRRPLRWVVVDHQAGQGHFEEA